MRVKIFFENRESNMGGFQIVSIFKIMLWIILGKIKPKENSCRYFIGKIETLDGERI